MGGKKAPPAPPQLAIPEQTEAEKMLQQKQIEQINQQMSQSDYFFGNSQSDRQSAFDYMDKLNSGYKLTDYEKNLAQQMSDQYYQNAVRDIQGSTNQSMFDTSRRDTIAGLMQSGMMNSTTATELMGNLEKARMQQYADAAGQAGMNNLTLQNQFYNQGTARLADTVNTLYSGSGTNAAQSAALSQNAMAAATNLQQQMQGQRMQQYNAQVQNAQSMYAYNLQKQQQQQASRSGLGGTIGTVLGAAAGAALAPFTGGLSLLAVGAGAGLGGGIGRSLF
jgi:hypothetical protein